ncbi:MAG: class I SAM-dependent methyltransferase [Theionarchaea archaeon]|nr:class I SAM-dependent methyltransferase [Theionarchaea archaeon]
MDTPMSNFHFRLLSLGYKIRDLLESRESILEEVNIPPGYHVLDFGCGPGSYIPPLSTMVGKSGKIYALDIHPLAVESVNKMIDEKSLTNVETILSGRDTHLPDECIDMILLYDIYHSFSDPDAILHELHRVLSPEGILSFSDHHLQEDEIITSLTGKQMFRLVKKGKKTFIFKKGKS